jgi:hypothetical protein
MEIEFALIWPSHSIPLCTSQSQLSITRCLKFNDRVAPPLASHIPFSLHNISKWDRIISYSSHICSISQIPNQCRESNHICEGDSRSSTRPSEVFVPIYPHVCVPSAYGAGISSMRGRAWSGPTVVFDQRRVQREGYQWSVSGEPFMSWQW